MCPQPDDEISATRPAEEDPYSNLRYTSLAMQPQARPLLLDADGYVRLSPGVEERLERIEAKLDLLRLSKDVGFT